VKAKKFNNKKLARKRYALPASTFLLLSMIVVFWLIFLVCFSTVIVLHALLNCVNPSAIDV
jgi:hypothetical protein